MTLAATDKQQIEEQQMEAYQYGKMLFGDRRSFFQDFVGACTLLPCPENFDQFLERLERHAKDFYPTGADQQAQKLRAAATLSHLLDHVTLWGKIEGLSLIDDAALAKHITAAEAWIVCLKTPKGVISEPKPLSEEELSDLTSICTSPKKIQKKTSVKWTVQEENLLITWAETHYKNKQYRNTCSILSGNETLDLLVTQLNRTPRAILDRIRLILAARPYYHNDPFLLNLKAALNNFTHTLNNYTHTHKQEPEQTHKQEPEQIMPDPLPCTPCICEPVQETKESPVKEESLPPPMALLEDLAQQVQILLAAPDLKGYAPMTWHNITFQPDGEGSFIYDGIALTESSSVHTWEAFMDNFPLFLDSLLVNIQTYRDDRKARLALSGKMAALLAEVTKRLA